VSSTKLQSGNYYTKDKTEDFKVFQTIPASSHLLANYDPFYSPLLSRIDTVFKQLGYTTEPCRERLVCQMYKNPAKFAPYSNLISAQLSRSVLMSIPSPLRYIRRGRAMLCCRYHDTAICRIWSDNFLRPATGRLSFYTVSAIPTPPFGPECLEAVLWTSESPSFIEKYEISTNLDFTILNEKGEQRELSPRCFTSPPRTSNLINNSS